MAITVTVIGEPELRQRLAGLETVGDRALLRAVEAAALLVQNAAKQRVPKRTRTLSRSITTEVTRQGDAVEARIGPSVAYGRFVEYGTGIHAEGGNGRQTPWVFKGAGGKFYTTSGAKPRPYMRPALDENREKAIREIARVFRAQMTRPGP